MINRKNEPLAHSIRPQSFDDVEGQDHLLNEKGVLRRLLDSKTINSMIFWGPPGSGKTTIVRLIAKSLDVDFVQISAIFSAALCHKVSTIEINIRASPSAIFIN